MTSIRLMSAADNVVETARVAGADLESEASNASGLESRLVSFQSPDGALRGSFRVEGCQVVDADISLKFPKWNKGSAFKTTLGSFTLNQVLNSSISVHTALGQLRRLAATCEQHHLTAAALSQHVSQICSEVTQSLRFAMRHLLTPPCDKLFPHAEPSLNLAFQPTLPVDMIVEFTVENKDIIISAYQLAVLTQAPTKPPLRQAVKGSPVGLTFQVVLHGVPHLVEVVDFAQVACPCQYETAVARIYNSIQLCCELTEKIRVLT
eukprot:TRINITY_DN1602_c0_g1_i3.p1 TRINITY_DN1602_c0_g1~~TRINITY_DN1602_c0_g1_i3.p1  ORF type:complete len:264 (+),score=20.65 TRINITY_DN1602_c0_g1_i3:405-1196(+)